MSALQYRDGKKFGGMGPLKNDTYYCIDVNDFNYGSFQSVYIYITKFEGVKKEVKRYIIA